MQRLKLAGGINFKGFLEECCQENVGALTNVTTMFEEYCSWCLDNRCAPISRTRFGQLMAERGYFKRRMTKGTVFQFVELLPAVTEDEKMRMVDEFCKEYFVYEPGSKMDADEVYELFRDWCRKNKRRTFSFSSFRYRMDEKCYHFGGYEWQHFRNLRLKNS